MPTNFWSYILSFFSPRKHSESEELRDLHARAVELRQAIRIESAKYGKGRLRDVLGEAYCSELDKLTPDEAKHYLEAVDESEATKAYMILARRLSDSMNVEICLKFLASSTSMVRASGTQIGAYLHGTRHIQASRLLAQIVRDSDEQPAVRYICYKCLQRVNSSQSLTDYLRYEPIPNDEEFGSLDNVDWDFVDSFLRTGS